MSTTNLNTNNFYHPALPLSPHGDTPIFRTSRISSEQGASLQDRTDHFSIGNTKKVRLSIIEQSEDWKCERPPKESFALFSGNYSASKQDNATNFSHIFLFRTINQNKYRIMSFLSRPNWPKFEPFDSRSRPTHHTITYNGGVWGGSGLNLLT